MLSPATQFMRKRDSQGDKLNKASYSLLLTNPVRNSVIMKRMLVTLNDPPFDRLEQMARRRGISVQMMLRSIVIPQWLQERTGQVSNEEQVLKLLASEKPRKVSIPDM